MSDARLAGLKRSDSAMASNQHYDRRTIVLHWLTAAMVALLWCIAKFIDDFDKGPPRIAARSVHIVVGAILVVIVVARILWRAQSGRRLPPSNSGALGAVEKFAQFVLYIALVTVLLLGMANAWIRGDSLFGLLNIHAPQGALHALKPVVEQAHKYAAHTLVVMATLHALAALYHHFVIRDGVLGRMRSESRV